MAKLTIELSEKDLRDAVEQWLYMNDWPHDKFTVSLRYHHGDMDPRCPVSPYSTVIVEVERG